MSSFGEMLKQSQRAVGNKLLEPKKIKEMLDLDQNTKKILIIDVRDAAEFEAASKDQHSRMPPLAGSVNMSLGTLFFKADQDMPDFVHPKLAGRDKSEPIITVCALGGQGLIAGKLMTDYGYNTYVVAGGSSHYYQAGCTQIKAREMTSSH